MPEKLYAIVIDVPNPTLKCFIAFPFSVANEKIEHPITDVIDRAVNQQRMQPHWVHWAPPGTPIVPAIESGIRGASMLIAVCSPEEGSGKANPNVMYEMGLADALGKPILMMTNDLSTLPFNIAGRQAFVYKDNELATREQRTKVEMALELAIAQLKSQALDSGLLVHNDAKGVWVVGVANRMALKDSFWSYAKEIFQFADQLYKLAEVVKGILRDLLHLSTELRSSELSLGAFMDKWKDYLAAHESLVVPCIDDRARERVSMALSYLEGHVPEAQKELLVLRTRYVHLCDRINEYGTAFNDVRSAVGAVADARQESSRLFGQVNELHRTMTNLVASADRVIHSLAEDINQWFYRPESAELQGKIEPTRVA
ncbi:MAG: hypothetical protein LAP21_00370 [Acidobacteriia bacterium]|nr:hypothetical protein [Terriglobia bacterium]